MNVELITSFHSDQRLLMHYDPLAVVGDSGWYELLERHTLGSDDALWIATATTGVSPSVSQVLLPLVVRNDGLFNAPVLHGFGNYYRPDWRPLCTGPGLEELVRCSFDTVLEQSGVGLVVIDDIDTDCRDITGLKTSLVERGWTVQESPGAVNWTETIEGTYDDWLAARPGQWRSTLKRRRNRLMKASGYRVQIYRDGTEKLDQFIDAYTLVYSKSWKEPEPYPDFIPDLTRHLASRGQLRLGVLWLDDEPIAAQMWIVHSYVAFIYKLAYVASAARYSPGTVLFDAMVRHVIDEDGITRLDFLSGDDAYKSDLMTQRSAKVSLQGYHPRSLVARLALMKSQYRRAGGILYGSTIHT